MLNADIATEILKGAKIKGRHPLVAAIFNNEPIPKEVWSKEVLNIEDASHWTPLTAMILTHRLTEIPEGLLNEQTLNKPNSEGWTPLHRTIIWGYASEANYLIDKGANPNIKTKSLKSCEELAMESASKSKEGNKTLLKLLNKARIKREKELVHNKLKDAPINI
jgi:hypothetical protein